MSKSVDVKVAQDAANNPLHTIYANKQVGERFEFGRYPQGEDGEIEPITWRVLRRDSDGLLVVSEQGLDVKPWNESPKETILWGSCTLREWLNNEFLSEAFNEQERSLIKETKVKDGIFEHYTYDYVFLLSLGEVGDLFKDDEDRKCKPTNYAKKNGAYTFDKNCSWWIRFHHYRTCIGSVVNTDGATRYEIVDFTHGSVRPALILKI